MRALRVVVDADAAGDGVADEHELALRERRQVEQRCAGREGEAVEREDALPGFGALVDLNGVREVVEVVGERDGVGAGLEDGERGRFVVDDDGERAVGRVGGELQRGAGALEAELEAGGGIGEARVGGIAVVGTADEAKVGVVDPDLRRGHLGVNCGAKYKEQSEREAEAAKTHG